MHIPFEACSTFTVSAGTNSGKTTLIFKILCDKYAFTEPVDRILYCYGVYQPLFDEMKAKIPKIQFHEGLPVDINSFATGKHCVCVLDDLMYAVVNDHKTCRLFTEYAHHLRLSVFFLTHNAFAQGKYSRTISLNSHYLILFRNLRDSSQILALGKQMYPGRSHVILEAYQDATSQKYGYLVIDMSPHSDDDTRLRANIFDDVWVYKPKQ